MAVSARHALESHCVSWFGFARVLKGSVTFWLRLLTYAYTPGPLHWKLLPWVVPFFGST